MLEDGHELAYDRCVLATGSVVARPPVPGAEDPAVHTVRTLDDGLALRALAARRAASSSWGRASSAARRPRRWRRRVRP